MRFVTLILIGCLYFHILNSQRLDNQFSQDLIWQNISPANMMGRIAAVNALNTDYRHVLYASASGQKFTQPFHLPTHRPNGVRFLEYSSDNQILHLEQIVLSE